MKRIILIVTFIMSLTILCNGQTEPKFVYCQIVGTGKMLSTKVNVVVDFGERMKVFADNRMKDESGKLIEFNSMVDALNYMGKKGWEFSQAYTITVPSGMGSQNVYHFLMKKPFADLDDESKVEFNKN